MLHWHVAAKENTLQQSAPRIKCIRGRAGGVGPRLLPANNDNGNGNDGPRRVLPMIMARFVGHCRGQEDTVCLCGNVRINVHDCNAASPSQSTRVLLLDPRLARTYLLPRRSQNADSRALRSKQIFMQGKSIKMSQRI